MLYKIEVVEIKFDLKVEPPWSLDCLMLAPPYFSRGVKTRFGCRGSTALPCPVLCLPIACSNYLLQFDRWGTTTPYPVPACCCPVTM